MRVLIVGPVDARDGGATTGGIATHVSELARALARAGATVSIYADNAPVGAGPHTHDWGRLYARPDLSSPFARLALLSGDGRSAWRRARSERARIEALGMRFRGAVAHGYGVARALRAERPEVIHYHQPDLRPFYAKLGGAEELPSLATLHSMSPLTDEREAIRALTLANLRTSTRIVTVSDDVRDGLLALDPTLSAEVVVNGVDLAAFSPAGRTAVPDRPLVLFAGRVVPEKGICELLSAFAQVREIHPRARLTLAGPLGFDVATAADQAGVPSESLGLPGPLAPEQVAALLREASVAVLPSKLREGQPRAIIEALASGVPVVATEVGSVAELLGNGAAGQLVAPGDADALGEALERALSGGSDVAAQVARGIEIAARFDVEAVAERLLGIYSEIADS